MHVMRESDQCKPKGPLFTVNMLPCTCIAVRGLTGKERLTDIIAVS